MVSGGCHFLSCNDEKRFGEVQEVLLCVLFVFVCSRSAEASYKRWLCPFVSPDPKWEAFRGQRVARPSRATRWPRNTSHFGSGDTNGHSRLIFHSSFARRLGLRYSDSILSILLFMLFWGSWRYRLPSFLMCFDTWEMWSVAYALRIYESFCPEVPAAYTSFQAWSWGNFRHGQVNLKPIKFQRESWKTVEGQEFWLSKFLYVYLDAFTNNFPGRHKCSSTPDSCASYRGNHSEPLDRWRTHRPPSVLSIAIEVISWCRTCLPIGNELGKEPARWKPPCMVHHGTVVQQSWVAVPLYHEQTNGAFVWIILNLGSCVGCSEALHKLRAGSSSEEEFCFKDTFRHSRTVSLKQNSYSDVLPAPSVCCILERHCSLVCPATVPCQTLLEILEICRLVRLNLDFMASETWELF